MNNMNPKVDFFFSKAETMARRIREIKNDHP